MTTVDRTTTVNRLTRRPRRGTGSFEAEKGDNLELPVELDVQIVGERPGGPACEPVAGATDPERELASVAVGTSGHVGGGGPSGALAAAAGRSTPVALYGAGAGITTALPVVGLLSPLLRRRRNRRFTAGQPPFPQL